MSEPCETWASALLLHLLSDRSCSPGEGDASSVGTSEALIANNTTELSQLILNLQCTPLQQRASQAALLESRISGLVKAIAGTNCSSDATKPGKPNQDGSDGIKRAKRAVPVSVEPQSGHGEESSEAHASFSHATDDDSLQQSDTFKLDSGFINVWVDKHFIEHEAAASRTVYDASCESSFKLLPSHIVFAGVAAPISTIRLATFTGPRFFGNMLYPSHPSNTPHPETHATPATQNATDHTQTHHPSPLNPAEHSGVAANSVEAAGVAPETMDVLLRIFEGAAPAQLSLQQAGEVFEAMDYCLVDPELYTAFFTYLQPMVKRLQPDQTVWILARCLNHAPEPCLKDLAPMAAATAASGHDNTTPEAPRAQHAEHPDAGMNALARLLERQPPAPQPKADSAAAAPLDAAEMACAADAARRELSQLRRGIKRTLALLLVAETPGAPLWLRVGSLAAAAASGELGSGCSGGCGGESTCSHNAAGAAEGDSIAGEGDLVAQRLLRQRCVADRDVLAAAAAVAAAVNAASGEHVGLVERVVKAACAAATQPGAGAPQRAAALPLFAAVLHGIGASAWGSAPAHSVSLQRRGGAGAGVGPGLGDAAFGVAPAVPVRVAPANRNVEDLWHGLLMMPPDPPADPLWLPLLGHR